MGAFRNLIKKIDEAIFKIVSELQSSALSREIVDKISGLSPTQQKIINHTASISFVSLPLILVLLLFLQNRTLSNRIEAKEEIKSIINTLTTNKQQLTNVGRQATSKTYIKDKIALKSTILPFAKIKMNNLSKVEVKEFKLKKTSESMSKVIALIKFSKFTTNNLTGLLRGLTSNLNATISSINSTRDKKTTLISGDIGIIHFGKNK